RTFVHASPMPRIFSTVPLTLTTCATESQTTTDPESIIESMMSLMVAVVRNSGSCCPCWACLAVQPEVARITTFTKAKNKYFRIATFLQNKLIDHAAVNCNSKWHLGYLKNF